MHLGVSYEVAILLQTFQYMVLNMCSIMELWKIRNF